MTVTSISNSFAASRQPASAIFQKSAIWFVTKATDLRPEAELLAVVLVAVSVVPVDAPLPADAEDSVFSDPADADAVADAVAEAVAEALLLLPEVDPLSVV